MDGENNEKPYFLMDDLGGFPLFLETPIYVYWSSLTSSILHWISNFQACLKDALTCGAWGTQDWVDLTPTKEGEGGWVFSWRGGLGFRILGVCLSSTFINFQAFNVEFGCMFVLR